MWVDTGLPKRHRGEFPPRLYETDEENQDYTWERDDTRFIPDLYGAGLISATTTWSCVRK
jgi:hypothetical protein